MPSEYEWRESAQPDARPGQWVGFSHAGQHYAVRARQLLGVLREASITAVPQGDERLAGVLAWRGDVLPVLKTECVLGPPTVPSDAILLLECRGRTLALPVEKVSGAIDLPDDDVLDSAQAPTGTPQHFPAVRLVEETLVAILEPDGLCDGHGALSPALL
ncbi:MAG: chemotaxis protein CheW [Gammaproteobacteria bacterium]|nr:chemotaxis protein CheW [Gammaproteobacteria bacterium]